VNALKGSPWGTFTIAATMPIALFMGLYMRYVRPGKVLECSLIGFVLVVAAIFGGRRWRNRRRWRRWFTLTATGLATAVVIYGFFASALPVWLLLAPARLSEHVREAGRGVHAGGGDSGRQAELAATGIHALYGRDGADLRRQGVSVLLHHHRLRAISGFHALISSGTTPKMIARDRTPGRWDTAPCCWKVL